MASIQLSKPWSINPNVRSSYTSLAAMAGWWIYENHSYMVAHGWTVKFTSNGVTGPSSGADSTDRIVNAGSASVRGASSGTAQSWSVLENPDGVQLMFAYQGASADVIRLSYSPSAAFAIATPSTNQPTASDEVVWSTGNSVVNSGTSLDRVMTIWSSDDGRNWSNALFRNNVLQSVIGFEKIDSYCADGVFVQPYIAYRYNSLDRSPAAGGRGPTWDPHSVSAGSAGWFGCLARIVTGGVTRTTRCGAGTIAISNIGNQNIYPEGTLYSDYPALQNGSMIMLPLFLSGERADWLDGMLGTPQDWWVGYASSLSIPATGDSISGFDVGDNPALDIPRTNWFVVLGPAMIRPWKNIAVSMETI